MTAVEPDAHAPAAPHGAEPEVDRPVTVMCPYLAAADGGWRSIAVAREHRCGAVSPPALLAPEKQRRLCLTVDHPLCATFGAARAARPMALDRAPTLPRPLARTTPVVLDHGRLAVAIPVIRSDRLTNQGILVGLMGIAFAAILLAKLTGGSGLAGAGDASPSPRATALASLVAATSSPTSEPTNSPAPSASAAPSSPPAATPKPTTAPVTYRIRSGDTLIAIATRFGTTTKALIALNHISNPSALHIGQVIRVR
jgi:LysM repeat protein